MLIYCLLVSCWIIHERHPLSFYCSQPRDHTWKYFELGHHASSWFSKVLVQHGRMVLQVGQEDTGCCKVSGKIMYISMQFCYFDTEFWIELAIMYALFAVDFISTRFEKLQKWDMHVFVHPTLFCALYGVRAQQFVPCTVQSSYSVLCHVYYSVMKMDQHLRYL